MFIALCLGQAIVLAPSAVAAGPQTSKDTDASLQLDQQIQVLKDEALNFNRDAQFVDDTVNYPDHARVDIYVSVETAALLLQTFSIRVDSGDAVTYTYSELDSKALLKSKGLQKIGRFTVAKGSHRLHAEFKGNYADAKPEEPAITDTVDVVFDKGAQPATLELIVGKANRRGKPILRLKEWREIE